eukprot:TRINITY_DN7537_c0_g1_i4.p1 TRINITY_DN7537_c0_g1~~TRINITY_DN7537_c0_g1_i4.p1  ORF type:complete len:448 (-),score=58.71 TRINITY_DN7537_c0_g1_i4:92-1435(-)
MLPLDTVSPDGKSVQRPAIIRAWLDGLRNAGAAGVMVDVWWGICEPRPLEYCFDGYVELCGLIDAAGLRLQAVMSFHSCGGNVGDSVNIPLPEWALQRARSAGLLYQDTNGRVSEDCLSLAADHAPIFPGSDDNALRTGIMCFRDFMASFATAAADFLGSTIVEIQVGMGPCGELRYPSYMASCGWNYPGVGMLMAHDRGMRDMLAEAVRESCCPADFAGVPRGEPSHANARPDESSLFRAVDKAGEAEEFRHGHGAFFLDWYRKALIAHGETVLREACKVFALCSEGSASVAFSVKLAGIHWHFMHPSRAAESCAGYVPAAAGGEGAYTAIARMLARVAEDTNSRVLLNFTCLEMSNGPSDASSAPEDLIAEVRQACIRYRIGLCGENALQFGLPESPHLLKQMQKQTRSWSSGCDRMQSVTLLRLDEGFARPCSWNALRAFAART